MYIYIPFQYTINAKVLCFTTDKEEIVIYGSKKSKRNILVADSTAKVTVCLYESLIDEVEEGCTYNFKNVSSRLYRNNFYLTTTATTNITKIDDLQTYSDVMLIAETTNIEGTIEQVQCTTKTKCPSCGKNLSVEEDAITVKCDNCKLKAKVSSLKKTSIFRINLKDEQKLYRLVSFQEAMEEFLKTTKKEQLLNNMDQLEDYLLALDKIKVSVAQDSDIISTIVTV